MVVGLAGPVENHCCELTNLLHWPIVSERALEQACGIEHVMLINDFAAAGLGVTTLKESDYLIVNDAMPAKDGVKAVTGPGTGLGQGFMCKSEFSPYYEVWPSEGGHAEFSVRSEEDFELLKFTHNYIENNQNVENLRAIGKINRVSIERLCAGPAVPLLYDFYGQKNKDLERVIEKEGTPFEQITSKMVIEKAIKAKDPLCIKVVEKFTEILGVEVGNLALKCLPFGGIYLIGGVTHGISEYILHSEIFLNAFFAKGR